MASKCSHSLVISCRLLFEIPVGVVKVRRPFRFQDFFHQATGCKPYPFQNALATSHTLPSLLDIPTGLGKTAGVIVAWLWRRFIGEGVKGKRPEQVRFETPRRLVYCLPMRVLVEQTAASAWQWIEGLAEGGLIPSKKAPTVSVLMGGEIDRDWDFWPDREAILIGTQDQLLSRALNRGYAMSRFRWPVHFGFLNNDALWVMDEVQLMGPGLLTTVQLQGFRERMGAYGRPSSIWMSATLTLDPFDTIDSPLKGKDPAEFCLSLKDDLTNPEVRNRLEARKKIDRCDVLFEGQKTYSKALASEVKVRHQETKGLTIVILNRVRRAQDVASALTEVFKGSPESPVVTLIHSRFRPQERRRLQDLVKGLSKQKTPNHILVSTQAIEAGVDISASTLMTELAPWSSLVQRFGRLNRYGEFKKARTFWIDIVWKSEEEGKLKANRKLALPYEGEELDLSRERLLRLADVGPQSLESLDIPSTGEIYPVVRTKDILELFDTTPDLAGNDIDVSPYIRDAENMDVSVFWREWEGNAPPADMPAPVPEELCPVPVYEIRDFLQDRTAWIWDGLERAWMRFDRARLRPGLTLLLNAEAGGYDPEFGWLGRVAQQPVQPVEPHLQAPEEAMGDDPTAETTGYVSIPAHCNAVVRELEGVLSAINYDSLPREELLMAALWHDRGKAHFVFQDALREDGQTEVAKELWAKSPRLGKYERPHFRHELASALALLLGGKPDLTAYLVAAHHGKVRLSIRSLPGEQIPPQGQRFARGL